jgi:hypothetical protein
LVSIQITRPAGATVNGEIDALIYEAAYNFENDTVGSVPSGWTKTTGTFEIAAEFVGHKNVLLLTNDGSNGRGYIDITAQTNPTVEFYLGYGAISQGEFYLTSATGGSPAVANIFGVVTMLSVLGVETLRVDLNHTRYDMTVTANRMYHIRVYLNTSTNKISVWVDDVLLVNAANNYNNNVLASLQGITILNRNATAFYVDAIDFSWSSGYYLNRNLDFHRYIQTYTIPFYQIGDQVEVTSSRFSILQDIMYVIETDNDYISRLSGAVLNNALYVEMNKDMKEKEGMKNDVKKLGYEVEDLQVKVEPTNWTAVSFTNSWVNYGAGYTEAEYRKVNDRVEFRGLIKNGTIDTSAFTLPTGFRPTNTIHLVTVSNGAIAFFRIDTSGVCVCYTASNVWFSIDGLGFSLL